MLPPQASLPHPGLRLQCRPRAHRAGHCGPPPRAAEVTAAGQHWGGLGVRVPAPLTATSSPGPAPFLIAP